MINIDENIGVYKGCSTIEILIIISVMLLFMTILSFILSAYVFILSSYVVPVTLFITLILFPVAAKRFGAIKRNKAKGFYLKKVMTIFDLIELETIKSYSHSNNKL